VEARRAFPQLMSMIRASTLLHQHQRKLDNEGRLVANANDYQLASSLLEKPFAHQLGGRISEAVVRFLETLWKVFGYDTFSTPEAIRHTTASPSAVYGYISELHRNGYLYEALFAVGRNPGQWKLLKRRAAPRAVFLPTVEELFGS
jgi:hypothetical protein